LYYTPSSSLNPLSIQLNSKFHSEQIKKTTSEKHVSPHSLLEYHTTGFSSILTRFSTKTNHSLLVMHPPGAKTIKMTRTQSLPPRYLELTEGANKNS